MTAKTAFLGVGPVGLGLGMRYRRRHSAEQLSAYDLEMAFQQIKLAANSVGPNSRVGSVVDDVVQYDVPKNPHKRSQCDINFECSFVGSAGIMYINGRIVSGPLDSLIEALIPKNVIDLDKCGGIEDRSRNVERWSGVAQYCLLVGNYNSAMAILEALESPAIARLEITMSRNWN